MLTKFYDNSEVLLKITGLLTTIAGLFLNINEPESEKALTALGSVQALFITLFIVCAIFVLWRIVKVAWREEGDVFKRLGIPNLKLITLATTYVSAWIALVLVNFALVTYPQIQAPFTTMSVTALILMAAILPLEFVDRNIEKISRYSIMIIWSFSFSLIISFLILSIKLLILKQDTTLDCAADILLVAFAASNLLFASSSYALKRSR